MTLTRLCRTMTKIYRLTTRMLFSHTWETLHRDAIKHGVGTESLVRHRSPIASPRSLGPGATACALSKSNLAPPRSRIARADFAAPAPIETGGSSLWLI